MKILLAAFLFLAAFQTPAPKPDAFDPARLSEKGRVAFETVRDAKVFSLGGVGEAGAMSREERALVTVAAEPNGPAALVALTEEATLEGKLLALNALRCLDRKVYAARLAAIRALPGPPILQKSGGKTMVEVAGIMVQQGCHGPEPRKCTVVLRDIEAGHYGGCSHLQRPAAK